MIPQGIGGPGWPAPDVPAQFSRGVDLAIVRDKRLHQHHWILVANFDCSEDTVKGLATMRDSVNAKTAKGETVTVEETTTDLPMGQDTLLLVEGPGCAKCGLSWDHDEGYGKLCQMSDRDWKGEAVTPPPGARSIVDAVKRRDDLLASDPGLMTVEEAAAEQDAEEVTGKVVTITEDDDPNDFHGANLDGDG